MSGLVPIAILFLAAWAYPRLRPGLRASLALVLGLFGVVAGIEGAYYTAKGGPSDDDFTGWLSLGAGVLLVGIGATILWRSRRRDGGRARRYARRVLVGVGALAALFFVLVPVYLSYTFTHVARGFVPAPDLGAAHENVSFTTEDGLRLEGWYVPSRNRAAVVAFPGRRGPQRQTRMLVRHGYGVLLFDRRGEGESDGDPNIFGWEGERDVHAAVEFLRNRPDVDPERIGGIGLSVGGEMIIEAAAESDGLRAVVSEGAGIRSLREAVLLEGTSRVEAVQFAFFTLGTALFANDLPPPSLEDLVGRISPRPLFLVYARHGQGGEELNPVFYDAAREPKEIWEISTGSHTGGIEAEPEEYERRVVGFFDRALLGKR
ncbi:MAG TPA: alpha/beta fold hydrolase [Gaiellaceae bacterium]|nr:alpha/beta fold hydrolase [Gaiellaceae bacterium]